MKRNRVYLFGGFLLLAFAGFSFSAFKETLTPYVSYEEARRGGQVQVAGALVKGSSSYETAKDAFYFTIHDPEDANETIRVRYHGLKPANFEEAISIVAIGSYQAGANEFTADKLLVKCPSKYQGAEVKEYT
ncbi:MAG TPA: cytochrome c maturation protein CcmE [Thermoanaerobaculia bacterium]|nr:cytochrome c maturation protein CcmE [Thermoanaerobaculia bacterium]